MRTWWLNLVDTLRGGFWFVPMLMGVAAVLAAAGLVTIDLWQDSRGAQGVRWLNVGTPDNARTLLLAILASTLTVLTVTFSVTIVAMTLASTQFGPRMLWNFTENRGTQVTLGVFVATCFYCVTVVGVLGRFDPEGRSPALAVAGAQVLAVVSLTFLVYFIHHIAVSIHASQVVAAVAAEVDRAIERWYPEAVGGAGREPEGPEPQGDARLVLSERDDYVQAVDLEALLRLATSRDLFIKALPRAGDFVVREQVLAEVLPLERVDDRVAEAVRRGFILGTQRTPTQDIEFAIGQLAEIAVRALSPAINDPFTAINAIDRLAAGLCRLTACRLRHTRHADEKGVLRLVVPMGSFTGIADAALDKVRQYGRHSVAVTIHLLDALRVVARHVKTAEQRIAIRRQAELTHRGALEAIPEPADRDEATRRFEAVMHALAEPAVPAAEAAAPTHLRA